MAFDYTQNLKKFLETDQTVRGFVASRIHHNNVPTLNKAEQKYGYIWLHRAGHVYDRTLDEAAGTAPRSVLYDLECCSLDLERVSDIADAVRALFPFSGTFGDSTVKGAFVNDQSEEYAPINESASVGMNVVSLQLEICP